jgi:hypothetical protein
MLDRKEPKHSMSQVNRESSSDSEMGAAYSVWDDSSDHSIHYMITAVDDAEYFCIGRYSENVCVCVCVWGGGGRAAGYVCTL